MRISWWMFARAAAVATVASRVVRVLWVQPPLTAASTRDPVPVAVVIPARDEAQRVAPAVKAALAADGVRDVVVVDDRSTDGTADVAGRAGARTIRALARPAGWAGKTWAMQQGAADVERTVDADAPGARASQGGLAVAGMAERDAVAVADAGADMGPEVDVETTDERHAGAEWLLFLDADVRVDPAVPTAMVARARADGLDLLAVAARSGSGPGGARWLHASMLTTLVYRFGAPGTGGRVLSSGQCVLVRRSTFDEWGGMAPVADSWVEDVALARWLTAAGRRVAFVDACDLVEVEPYESFTATWSGWGRSLGLPDVDGRVRRALDVVVLTLAMPVPFVRMIVGRADVVDFAALAMRLGTLVGIRRAFATGGPSFWLSPFADAVSVASLAWSLLTPHQRWRGRPTN